MSRRPEARVAPVADPGARIDAGAGAGVGMGTTRDNDDRRAQREALRQQVRVQLARHVGELGEREVRELLGAVLPFGSGELCANGAQARLVAQRLGFPVVVKIFSAGALHKSDLGLVRIGLGSPGQVEAAADELLVRAQDLHLGDAQLSVQRQLSGVEMAVGVRRDPLGALCMVADGGTLIEVHQDTAFAMAPLTEADVLTMIDRLRVAKVLRGFRGSAAVDIGALVRLVVEVATLASSIPEIAELDLNPVFVDTDRCVIADARCVVASPASEPAAEPAARDLSDLSFLLRPERVAILGASNDQQKVGGLLVKYMRKHAFGGDLVAVRPSGTPVPGVRTVRSLSDEDQVPDLALVSVPAASVAQAVDDCVAAGVRGGIMYSAGFAEAGEEGKAAQDRLVAASLGKFRFLGPNSMGIAVPSRGYVATFGMALEADDLASGPIGFVSQSGALASSLFSRSPEFGTGFSHWVSVGNEADIGTEEVVAALADEPECRIICLFLEVVRRPAAFAASTARALAAGKAVVAFKTGSSEAGRAAAVSHTGALSGSDTAYGAFFDRLGVVRVQSLPGLFVAAQGILGAGPVGGSRVGILSMSGGACSVLADACAGLGLQVPQLDEVTQGLLRQTIPAFGGVRNPVDVTAVGIQQPHLVRDAVEIVRRSGCVDLVLVQLSTNADPAAAQMAEDLVGLRQEDGPPILVGRLGSAGLAPRAMEIYGQGEMHVFGWPEQLAEAAAACVAFGRTQQEGPVWTFS